MEGNLLPTPLSALADCIGRFEGLEQRNPNDSGNWVDCPGGSKLIGTMRGVTPGAYAAFKRIDPCSLTLERMEAEITADVAAEIGLAGFYAGAGFDKLEWSPLVWIAVDIGWGSGPVKGIKMLQRLIGTPVDGVIGPMTVIAYEDYLLRNDIRDACAALAHQRAEFYKAISKPGSRNVDFLKGWLRRATYYSPGGVPEDLRVDLQDSQDPWWPKWDGWRPSDNEGMGTGDDTPAPEIPPTIDGSETVFRIEAEAGYLLLMKPKLAFDSVGPYLEPDTVVRKLRDVEGSEHWWEVSADIGGRTLTGFLPTTVLAPLDSVHRPAGANGVTAVHLEVESVKPVRRDQWVRWAYPLSEPGQPRRDLDAGPVDRAGQLVEIVNWLDVENAKRWAPTPKLTFCNVYAYDYCYLAGVYFPRVWWGSPGPIERLRRGERVVPDYGKTIFELDANALHDWAVAFHTEFGWRRTTDLDELQFAANEGKVGVITWHNRGGTGHVSVVMPEHANATADRPTGHVSVPLQSQAGRNNRKLFADNWWPDTGPDVGFWIHD